MKDTELFTKNVKEWYESIDISDLETFTRPYQEEYTTKQQQEYVSDLTFQVYEDKDGVLYLVTYDTDFGRIQEVFYGYEKCERGTLSNHIKSLYDCRYQDVARYFWLYKLKYHKSDYVYAIDMKSKFLYYDDIADEFGIYQDNFGKSSNFEFNRENLLMVSNLIYE